MISGIICFGDSILAGTGATERDLGCSKLIKSALSLPVSLRARNWNTSADGLNRLEKDVISQPQYSHVVILFGNNDCWLVSSNQPKVSLSQMEENFEQMAKRIKSNGQTPVYCNLQPIDSELLFKARPELFEYKDESYDNPTEMQKRYSRLIEQFTKKSGCHLIDIRTELEEANKEVMATDGIHPNDRGHKIIARKILNDLKNIDLTLKLTDHYEQLLIG